MHTINDLGALLRNYPRTFPKTLQFIPKVIAPRDMNTGSKDATQVYHQDSRSHSQNYCICVHGQDVPVWVNRDEKSADKKVAPEGVTEDESDADDNEGYESVGLAFSRPSSWTSPCFVVLESFLYPRNELP